MFELFVISFSTFIKLLYLRAIYNLFQVEGRCKLSLDLRYNVNKVNILRM